MTTIKPITPDEVLLTQPKQIPPEVVEAFNELIVKNWNGSSARVMQNEVINKILGKMETQRRETTFDTRHLNICSLFDSVGWRVDYDKPAYYEGYEPSFTFYKK